MTQASTIEAKAKAYLGGAKPSDIRERNEVIAGLYSLGHSQREISYRFGICQQTVSGICVKLGSALHDPVERNKRAAISRRIKWTPEMDAAVLKLRATGMTFYDIAARVGVAHHKARLRYHTLAGTKPATYVRRVSA